MTDYLLDTNGLTYKVVYDIKDIDNTIEAIDLSVKVTTAFPKEILENGQLKILRLYDADSVLPAGIAKLVKLQWLDLRNCKIDSLPLQINKLKNLTSLYLSGNSLTTLPSQIGKLKNLISLNLRGNKFLSDEQERVRKLLPSCEIYF